MSGFKVELQTAGPHVVTDLGLTLNGAISTIVDLTDVQPNDLARSTDLEALVTGGDILVVDSRDDTDATIMSLADSLEAIRNHNDTHFGVTGGRFGAVDDPTFTPTDDFILQYDSGTDAVEYIDPATLVTQTTVQEAIEDIVGGMGVNGTDTTFVYTDGAGTIQWNVDDSFLRNDGDTLDSGTLTIASGATVDFPTGSTITIAGGATATIATPVGGFTGGTDLINKDYVDSLAGGFDYKESVRVSSTPADGDITGGSFGGTYAAAGGPTATGEFTGVDLSAGTGDTIDGLNFTGTSSTGLVIGDRVLIKDQADATQNGIYEITAGPATSVTLTRAEDQDGSPAAEVSGGNTTFVEDTTAIFAGSTNSNSRWSVLGDGILTLNTDDIDWTITGGSDVVTDGIGISKSGNIMDLDVDDLVAATPVGTDLIAFHDGDGVAEASGSQTRKVTFDDLLETLNVPHEIGGGTGLVVKTGDSPDTYTTRTIAVDGAGNLDGLVVADGDGVSGDPTIGLDIQNLPARSDAVDTTDRVAVWNVTADANEYYTISEIAGAVSASDSFSTWTRTGNGSGADVVADSSSDTVTLDGGIGINLTFTPGTDTVSWAFSRDGMADTAVVGTDTVPFFDGSNSNEPEFRSWDDIITDLGIATGTGDHFSFVVGSNGGATATAIGADILTVNGTGIDVTTTNGGAGLDTLDLVLDISDLSPGGGTVDTTDSVAVDEAGTTVRYLWSEVITDLGLLTSSATFFWTDIVISGGNSTGDATVSPTIASDTLNLSAGVGLNFDGSDASDTITATFTRTGMSDTAVVGADTVPFFDASNSNAPEFRSWSDIITDLGINTSGNTSYWGSINTTGNTAGDTTPAADPDAADDDLTFNGGIGITITGTAAADTVSWAFTRAGMADTAVVAADTVSFFDASNSNEPEFRSFSDILGDLDVPNGISSNGFVVRTAADTYAARSITASTAEDFVGINVVNGDGVAGNPEIGLDIDGLTDAAEDMTATDEFPLHNKSEGTGGANRKMTGQDIADGVATILGLDNNLTFSTINGQEILTFDDPNRASKTLSIDSNAYQFSDNNAPDGGWVEIGNATDADAGHIMPFDGTVVGVTAMTENAGGETFELDLFINGTLDTAAIATLTGTGVDTDVDVTLNRDFSQGDRLRLQVDQTSGSGDVLGDCVVTLMVRWRA